MNIFGKFKGVKDLDSIRESQDDAVIEEKDVPKKKDDSTHNKKIQRLEMEIDSLKAQTTSMKEIIKENNERFSRINEEIGEIRTFGIEREKKIRDIEVKAEKAAGLVEQVHPESLMSELKKESAKLEAVKAKTEAQDMMSNKIITDLKDIKVRISTFRGTEEIINLNKDVRNELISIKKIEANIEKRADRIEAIFTTFEKNFETFEQLKDGLKDVKGICSALRTDVEKNAVSIKGVPKKEEFYSIKNDVKKTLDIIINEKTIYDKRNNSLESNVKSLVKRMDHLDSHMNKMSKGFEEVSKASTEMVLMTDEIKDISKELDSINQKIALLDKKATLNSHQTDSLLTVIEKMMTIRVDA